MANRDIVVIGGSAGSSAPLRTILSRLPADLSAAILVVLHVPTEGPGILTAIAQASKYLPIKKAEDGDVVTAGRVYVAPPDHHLLIMDDRLLLGNGPKENLARPSIDPLFRSAALCCGPRVIGVILSGMMNDGASGLSAIKTCGGIALVQTPKDALSADMPLAALEATPVDLSAPADDLADAIINFTKQPPGPKTPVPVDIRIDVAIAAGRKTDPALVKEIADPSPLTCPECGGVLSEVRQGRPLRFRCQVGHGYTAAALMAQQQGDVDEAMRIALRIIEERAALVSRMAKNAVSANRQGMAQMHEERAEEYRKYADILRAAILQGMEEQATIGSKE